MATINITAKSKDKKTATIYVEYQDAGRRFLVSTGEHVAVKHWDKKRQRAKAAAPAAVELNALLDAFAERALKAQRERKVEDKPMDKETLARYLFPNTRVSVVKHETALEIYNRFLAAIEPTRRSGTMKHYTTIQSNLRDYEKAKGAVALGAMDAAFLDSFVVFCMETYGNNNVTLNKKARTVIAFLNWAERNGYETNPKYKQFKFGLKDTVQRKTHLTLEELRTVYEFPITESAQFTARGERNESAFGRLEKTRDLFCFACFTGLRFSDVRTFRKESVRDGAMRFLDQKTGEENFLPLLPQALAILEKYDYALPAMSHQKVNDYIKELCHKAGINDKIIQVTFRGAQRVEKTVEKWETVSMHTARRTFISLSLQMGIRLEVVQALVGHNDVRTTLQYVDVNEDVKRAEMEKWRSA